MNKKLVPIAKIIGAHGVKGYVKIKCYLVDPVNLLDYDIYDKNSEKVEIDIKGIGKKESLIISINDIHSKDEVAKFLNKDLFIKREALPELPEDEYYYHDIIGLQVLKNGEVFGIVKDMYNHGAGDLVEIKKNDGKTEVLSFNDENFPEVNLKNNIIYMSELSEVIED